MTDEQTHCNGWRDQLRDLLTQQNRGRSTEDQEIAALVAGELEGDQRTAALQRVISSPEALQKYKTLTDMHLTAQPTRTFGVAATMLLAVTAALIVTLSSMDDVLTDNVVRSPLADQMQPADRALMTDFPEQFRWPSESGATRLSGTRL